MPIEIVTSVEVKIMITVAILINGHPIIARSATRVEEEIIEGVTNTYKIDTGEIINHMYNEGVVVLAKKLLDTIVED